MLDSVERHIKGRATKSDEMINAFTISTFIHIVTCSAPTSLSAGYGLSDVDTFDLYHQSPPAPHIDLFGSPACEVNSYLGFAGRPGTQIANSV